MSTAQEVTSTAAAHTSPEVENLNVQDWTTRLHQEKLLAMSLLQYETMVVCGFMHKRTSCLHCVYHTNACVYISHIACMFAWSLTVLTVVLPSLFPLYMSFYVSFISASTTPLGLACTDHIRGA